MQETIKINKLNFKKYIDDKSISSRVREIANLLNEDDSVHEDTVFVVLLNGAFVFAADLLRQIKGNTTTLFIKVSSYEDLASTGVVHFQKSALSHLAGKDIVIIEDIIDTGQTLYEFTQYLSSIEVASIKIVTLLLKPDKLKHDLTPYAIGFSIPDLFVIGYGLDYNENARGLKDIYILD
jgi:hypoxanthine phosphoribosyltransferase